LRAWRLRRIAPAPRAKAPMPARATTIKQHPFCQSPVRA
jgi:hypothetical protein